MKVKCIKDMTKRTGLFDSTPIYIMREGNIYNVEFFGQGEYSYVTCVFYGEHKEWETSSDFKTHMVPTEE